MIGIYNRICRESDRLQETLENSEIGSIIEGEKHRCVFKVKKIGNREYQHIYSLGKKT